MKILLLSFLLLLCSCGRNKTIQDFIDQINSNPKYNFKLLKVSGRRPNGDYAVLENSIDDKIFAVDIESYDESGLDGLTFFENHLNDNLIVEIVSSYETEQVQYRYVYLGDELVYIPYTITLTEYVGDNGLIYHDESETPKDLESVGAFRENLSNEKVIFDLVNQYGLSLDRAKLIASIRRHYLFSSSQRTLTKKEMSNYFIVLTGTDYLSAKKAFEEYISGNKEKFDRFLINAANYNKTAPEAVMKLISEMFLQ